MIQTPDGEALTTFDWTGFDSVSTAVVAAVAAQSDSDPMAVEPLYESVDPDSLNVLFTTPPSGTPSMSVEFEHGDYWIVVKANGRGYLYEELPG